MGRASRTTVRWATRLIRIAVATRRDGPTALQETCMTNSSTSAQAPALLGPGTPAPDFALHATPDQILRLSELRGHPVILVFYPADWSPVCGDQVALYNEVLPEFKKHRAQVLGISVDGIWSHLAYSKDRKLKFPLLSDFEPKGEVARKYGVFRSSAGVAER